MQNLKLSDFTSKLEDASKNRNGKAKYIRNEKILELQELVLIIELRFEEFVREKKGYWIFFLFTMYPVESSIIKTA